MYKMGFEHDWVRRVMMFVKSISYSILINGEPKGLIQPFRGLRQGDYLSTYLFLLFTEGLISLMHQVVARQLLTGIRICRGAPYITHLFLVDDSVLFFKANMIENRKVMETLEVYEQALGQQINKDKTSMSFIVNM